MENLNPYDSPRLDESRHTGGANVAPFARWIRYVWIASSLVHGLLAAILTLSEIRFMLIVTGVMRGYVGDDPKVQGGIALILVLSWCASIAAWRSRYRFAKTPLLVTALVACSVVISGFFIVPLDEAWIGIVNAAIASGVMWITAAVAWLVPRAPRQIAKRFPAETPREANADMS